MDRPIFLDNVLGLETATLREIVRILREMSCGSSASNSCTSSIQAESLVQQRIEGIRSQTSFTAR